MEDLCFSLQASYVICNIYAKMLSSNQIAGLFYHQYIWKEIINILDFVHRDSYHDKIVTVIISVGWVMRGMSSLAQTCLDLSGVNLVGMGVWGMAILGIIQCDFFFYSLHIHMYSLNNFISTYKIEIKSIKSGTRKNNL